MLSSSSTNKGMVFLVTNTAPLGMDLPCLLTLDERCLIAVGFFGTRLTSPVSTWSLIECTRCNHKKER